MNDLEALQQILKLGFVVDSKNYRINTTNWGDGETKFEYALEHNAGKVEYFYEDGKDNSYIEALETILEDKK